MNRNKMQTPLILWLNFHLWITALSENTHKWYFPSTWSSQLKAAYILPYLGQSCHLATKTANCSIWDCAHHKYGLPQNWSHTEIFFFVCFNSREIYRIPIMSWNFGHNCWQKIIWFQILVGKILLTYQLTTVPRNRDRHLVQMPLRTHIPYLSFWICVLAVILILDSWWHIPWDTILRA